METKEVVSVVFEGERLLKKGFIPLTITKVRAKTIFYRYERSTRNRRCSHADMARWIQEGVFQKL